MQLRRLFSAAIVVLTMAAPAFAQGTFTINGRAKIEGGGLDGTRVVVYRNGTKDRVVTNNLSKFSLELDLNQSYVLSFEKEGFVTKKLSFDTHAPADAVSNGFTPFEFAVSLFKQYDDVNTVVFNQPVGMIRFDPAVGDFDYDTDYTKSIQSQLQLAQQQVQQKQQEETAKAEEDAKRNAEAEKARLKAEAEAKRKAAEDEKALARQQREAEEAARKAEAERVKAAQAAKKAEQEKASAEARKAREEQLSAKPPEPAPVAKAEPPKPRPAPVVKAEAPKPPPPPSVHVSTSRVKANTGADERRPVAPRMEEEESPVRKAAAVERSEQRPEEVEAKVEVVRDEELIVEPGQVVTLITLATDAQKNEYRKVVRKYGGTFYFKNGQPCSQLIYESEALADR